MIVPLSDAWLNDFFFELEAFPDDSELSDSAKIIYIFSFFCL